MKTKARSARPPVDEHCQRRLRACREAMAEAKVDALLLVKPQDIFYLTGFSGEDSGLLVTLRTAHLVTDSRFDEQARSECPWLPKTVRKGSLIDALAGQIRRRRIDRLGLDESHLSVAQFDRLAKPLGRRTLKRVGSLVAGLRTRKDPREIELLRQAVDVAERAFQALRKSIRRGRSERALAARLEYELQCRGAQGSSFPPIVAVGPRSALPHASPSKMAVSDSMPILFDWGATCGHYRSDLTRVLLPRRIRPRIRRMYEVCLEAQKRAIEAVRPGERMKRVDSVARRYIAQAGFGSYFGHGLGHGIGLEIHEAPTLSPRSKKRLEPGMVVTIEPGIYLPGVGGIRIEDDVLVTEQGHQVLSGLGKELDEMVWPA